MQIDESDETRSIQPLSQPMAGCKVIRENNLPNTDEQIIGSLARKATHKVKAIKTPSLQEAITTADELMSSEAEP